MIVNPFFEQTYNNPEQDVLEDLVNEALETYGINVYYVLRSLFNYDKIYQTDDMSIYDQAIMIDMYMDNYMGFHGDRAFMSKFAGLEIRDKVTFTISRRRFEQDVTNEFGLDRPREGDLIYFPLAPDQKTFQIKYVEQSDVFYQLNKLYVWKVEAELFEYSNELFMTGIPEIDLLQQVSSTNVLDYLLLDTDDETPLKTEDGDFITIENYDIEKIDPLAINDSVEEEEEAKGYIDWSEDNPFSADDIPGIGHKI